MKKIVLLSLSLLLFVGMSAIGYGNTNEKDKISNEISIAGIDFEYIQEMKKLEQNISVGEKCTCVVYVESLDEKDQTIFTYSVALHDVDRILLKESACERFNGNLIDRSKQVTKRLRQLEERYGVKPIVVTNSRVLMVLGGRNQSKSFQKGLFEHVLKVKDGLIVDDYFRKT